MERPGYAQQGSEMERQRPDRISIEKAKRGIAMLRNGTAGKARTGEVKANFKILWALV
jgi:hypothetical protein